MDVSIVIVSYNSRSEIDQCLQSIARETTGIDYETIVIDNASTDGTAQYVRKQFPDTCVVENTRNLGFATACNQGWRRSSGKYIYFLNPDSKLANNACLIAQTFFESRRDIGIIGTKILNNDGGIQFSCRSFPTLMTSLFNRYSLLSKLWPGNTFSRKYLLSDFDHSVPVEVDWVSGASMFARRSVLENISGFDEDYFLYCEDVDICLRAKKAGWKTWFLSDAVVWHGIAGSSSRISEKALAARHRSMWRYYRKHFRRKALLDVFVFLGLFVRHLLKTLLKHSSRISSYSHNGVDIEDRLLPD